MPFATKTWVVKQHPVPTDKITSTLRAFIIQLPIGETLPTSHVRCLTKKGYNHTLKLLQAGIRFQYIKEGDSINHTSHRSPEDRKYFERFKAFETVSYWRTQLNESKRRRRNMKKPNYSTRELYTDNLFRFDKWLRGREKNFRLEFPDNGGGLKTVEVHFDNVEELFRAFKSEINVYGQREYIKIIKQYLLDSMHEGKMVSSMANAKSAILSYFEKNDCPLPPFSIDLTTKYEMADMQPAITREDLLRMLIDRRVSIRDVAIIMNVWHRGLDESTFVEEFNYKAWDQIVKVLGTDYEHWDLDKCPIPIWVRRIKTDALTLGCIERDAVTFLAKWLKVREQILLCPMKSGEPLFINGRKNPITERDIWFQFKSLAIQAGLQMTLPGYKLVTRYKFHAHELRDLLKTTCTEAGVQTEYSEAFICHKAFSSYDKLQQSDTERYRQEYSKLSPYINIFSNSISNAKITTEISKKAQKIETLEKGFTDMQERLTKVEKEKEEMREMIERLRHSRIPEQQQTS